MEELGYSVEWQVFNSKYFVPQNRERVYIIGHFRGFSGREVLPIGAYGEAPIELQGRGIQTINTRKEDGREQYQQDRIYKSRGGISPALNRGKSDLNIISNTLAHGDRKSVGIYPDTSGGVSQSKRIPQSLIAGFKGKPKKTDIASTLQARDYKGVSNQGMTVVYEEDNSDKV